MSRRSRFEPRGAHIVVTGASRGLGNSLARELARRGARVTAVARNKELLGELATDIGGVALPADLSDLEQVGGLIERIEDRAGPIDMLFNGAAHLVVDRREQRGSARDVAATLTVNLHAPIELTRQLVPRMAARGSGTIVNVSSLAGISAFPTLSTYGATKAGIALFTAGLRRELKHTPVRAVLLQLGQVRTDMIVDAHQLSPILAAATARIGRIGFFPEMTPDEAAAGVADGLASGRPTVVVPRRIAPLHHIRELPTWLNDSVLLGLRP